MKFLDSKDLKRNKVLFITLGLSLFLVPFASNPMIRFTLTFFLFLLFLNTISIITKFFRYKFRKNKPKS